MDIKKTDENHVALLAHVILFWAENFGIKTTQYAFKANISRSIKVNNSTRHGHIQLTNATILNKILCFFFGTGNFISTFKKEQDWTPSQTRSDEVIIVSQNFVFISFSRILQGLGRSSPSLEIFKPQFDTHFFLWPAYKKPHFTSLSQKRI